MCDLGTLDISKLTTGENMKSVASILGDVGEFTSQKDVQKQYKEQLDQIVNNTKLDIEQTAYRQERFRAGQKANYGKAGVKMTGSAVDLINEQIKQDEIELLNKKYEANIRIKDVTGASRQAGNRANTALSTGLAKAAELYNVNKGFGLGNL